MYFGLYITMKFRFDFERFSVDFKHWKFNHFLPPHDSYSKTSLYSNPEFCIPGRMLLDNAAHTV